jgi:hypothetical protein
MGIVLYLAVFTQNSFPIYAVKSISFVPFFIIKTLRLTIEKKVATPVEVTTLNIFGLWLIMP